MRPAVAIVDLGAVRANVQALRDVAAPAQVMAVVKADGYGHGAIQVSRAALEAGAEWLGVALVEEGAELRQVGSIDAPIMVLSEPPIDAAPDVVALRLTPVVYREGYVDALAKAVAETGTDPLPVHLKIDTGMHRAGCDAPDAVAVAKAVLAREELVLDGVMTHLAVADEPGNDFTEEQLGRFEAVLAELRSAGIEPPMVHAANSAGALAWPAARYDLVRCGIAMYGSPPAPEMADGLPPLTVALELTAAVSLVRRVEAGEGVSYGLRYRLERPSTIAVVPIGYGDGIPRRLGQVGAEVLVNGRRYPVAGTVTMDQLMVDCGDDEVAVGDEVVLLGRRGDEEITPTEWAQRLDTVAYEITCAISTRVPRRYIG